MLTIYAAKTDELKDKLLFNKLYHAVPQYRQQKIDRMRFDKDKRLSLGAGLLLKYALHQANIDENSIHIDYSPNKKPYIREYSEFHFNLSHSESCVVCAVSNCETGCDVEKVTVIDWDIAQKYFSASEYEMIINQPNPVDKIDMFFRLWTLKESYIKATSLGFELAMNCFAIRMENDKIWADCNIIDKHYTFYEFDIFPDYKCAACVKSASMDVSVNVCHFSPSTTTKHLSCASEPKSLLHISIADCRRDN